MPRGRPMKYTDPAQMQAVIDRYFESCKGHYRKDENGNFVFDRNGRPILDGAKPLTMAGVQYALGFGSRQSLCDYQRRRGFSRVINRARLMVETYCAERLFDREGYSGAAFVLRTAFGWGAASDAEERRPVAVKIIMDG